MSETETPTIDEPLYKERSDDDLKQLARDYVEGRIFTDRHVPDGEDPLLPFLALRLAALSGSFQKYKDDPPGMFFEYLSEAGPRSINGMPSFMSFQMLSRRDVERMATYVKEYETAVAPFNSQPNR